MKSLFRATAILGSSSLVTIIVGLVTSKAYALLLGPNGLGLMGLLQSLVGLTGMIAGLGVGSGLIRIGANALARDAETEIAALRRAAWVLFAITAITGLCVLTLFRVPLSLYMLGTPDHAASVALLGIALVFSLAAGIQTSTLNAHQRLGALAKTAIINSIATACLSVFLVARLGEQGIAPSLIGGAVVNWVVSSLFLWREIPKSNARPTRTQITHAVRALVRFGLPFTASMVVGTGVQLLLPIIILHLLDQASVGFYRAAVAISVGYIGFLLTAMAQDYYPRVSAVSNEPEALSRLINEQHRFVMLLGVPLILCAMASTPYLVPLIYSAQFQPAAVVLEWQLAGSIFKFSSWTMSYVILARSGSSAYFLIELVAGIASLCTAWLGVRWFGLAGLGIGFCVTYLIYYGVVWLVIRRAINFEWEIGNMLILLAAASAATLMLAISATSYDAMKLLLNIVIAALSVCASSYVLLRKFNGLSTLRMRFSSH
jgi:PST family polysaccharide transporter